MVCNLVLPLRKSSSNNIHNGNVHLQHHDSNYDNDPLYAQPSSSVFSCLMKTGEKARRIVSSLLSLYRNLTPPLLPIGNGISSLHYYILCNTFFVIFIMHKELIALPCNDMQLICGEYI